MNSLITDSIKPVEVADLSELAVLQARADGYADYLQGRTRKYQPSISTQERIAREKLWRLYYNDVAKPADRFFSGHKWIADGEMLGCIFTTAAKVQDRMPLDCTSRIESLFVHPDYWGQKIAQRLLMQAEKFLQEKGCNNIILWADVDSSIACKFYDHLGWKQVRKSLKPETINGRHTGIVMYQRKI